MSPGSSTRPAPAPRGLGGYARPRRPRPGPAQRALLALALALAAGALPKVARAEDALTVRAELSDTRVVVGDMVTLQVDIAAHADGAIELSVPQVDGLTEIGRSKSEGTSISFDGFHQQITKQYTLQIQLQAEKPGRLTIPPVTASVGDQRAASRPLTLEVTASAAGDAEAARPGEVEPPSASERNLFLRYSVDRASATVGEQMTLALDIYASPQIRIGVEEASPPPTLDGFWREILDQPERFPHRAETVDGRRYDVFRVWKIALFPLNPGTKVIAPAQATFDVNRSFFGGERVRRRTPPVKLEVKPLPQAGRPPGFNPGNVGTYTLAASVDHDTVRAGQAVTLTLALTGQGNIKNAHLPELGNIRGFKAYAPNVSDEVQLSAAGVSGTKKADILLMPEAGGRLEIPTLSLPVYDPAKGEYSTLTTRPIAVNVQGDPAALAAAARASGTAPAPATSAGRDQAADAGATRDELRPLRYRSELERAAPPPWHNPIFLSLSAMPPFFYGLVVLIGRVLSRARRETPESRRRRAAQVARSKLAGAARAVTAGETQRAYAELVDALLDFAGEKLGTSLRGLTVEETRGVLARHGAPLDLVDRVAKEMEAADYARFAPGVTGAVEASALLERWTDLLGALDAWTPKEAQR